MATGKIIFFALCLLFPCYLSHEDFIDLRPFLNIYKSDTIERSTVALSSPLSKYTRPKLDDPQTCVSSKDIVIFPATNVSARIYLPDISDPEERVPVLLYFHGGGFCIGSAFGFGDHSYLTRVASQSKVIIVSVNYRLAPEHKIPAAYIDAWSALRWIASHRKGGVEPWLVNHGDFRRVFVGGDSAGGNIVHNVVMWAGRQKLPNHVRISGAVLVTPYFLGSKPVEYEAKNFTNTSVYKVWKYVCPSCKYGVDDMHINPLGPGAPSLKRLKCKKIMVYVGETDVELRARGIWYYRGIKASGWKGKLRLYEAKGVGHVFPIFSPEDQESKKLMKRLAKFLQN